jgi:hypothetical protein
MMVRDSLLVCLGVLFIDCLSPRQVAFAYRPFNGTNADVAKLGEFELELGPLQVLHQQGRNYLLAPATVLNLGIVPRTELVAEFVGNIPLHAERGENRYGLRDTDVFVKVLLRKGVLQDEDAGPSIALEAGPLTPEIGGDRGFGASTNVIVSERWGWFVVHLDDQAVLTRADLDFAWSSSLITEYHFSERAFPVMELLWERVFQSHVSVYSALAGAIWKVSESVDLDAAAIVASVAGKPSVEARLGFTWALRVWETPEEPEKPPEVHD